MIMNKEEQKEFVNRLMNSDMKYDLRFVVWHPTSEQLNWVLSVKELRVKIHPDCPGILNMYDGASEYSSPVEVTLYFKDECIDGIREHEKLKDLYNEWYLNKQKKGGNIE